MTTNPNQHDTDRAPKDNTPRGCAIVALGTLCFWGVVLAFGLIYIAGWWRINQLSYLERFKGPRMTQQ